MISEVGINGIDFDLSNVSVSTFAYVRTKLQFMEREKSTEAM